MITTYEQRPSDPKRDAIPYTRRYVFAEASEQPGYELEFRLVYRGQLPAQGSGDARSKEKHRIRKAFHPQLKELWQQHDFLRFRTEPHDKVSPFSYVENIAENYRRCDHRFVPLVTEDNGLACSLGILFLRRDSPGNLVQHGGDLDNRIKTLFDGLRFPESCAGVTAPGEGEDPFFCLLSDDSLITDVSVTTDRLLVPQDDDERVHDVVLIVHVKTKIVGHDRAIGGLWHLGS
jgi:hypothetical protein